MDISNDLKDYATLRGWKCHYARRDYQNLVDATTFVADTVEGYSEGETMMFIDPIRRKSLSDGISYAGSFMVLTKSDLDDDYFSRKQKYIDPLINTLLKTLKDRLKCNYDVDLWDSVEVINQFDWNADGLAITFSVRSYE